MIRRTEAGLILMIVIMKCIAKHTDVISNKIFNDSL